MPVADDTTRVAAEGGAVGEAFGSAPSDWSHLTGVGAGAAMGLVISSLGAGGSLFIVPVLLYVFHQPVASATGTSLAVVFAAALVGALMHARNRNVKLRVAFAFAAGSIVTAPVGALLHPLVPDRVSIGLFALVLVVAAARMIVGNKAHDGENPEHRLTRLTPLGAAVGVLTGFLGVGGGFVIVPALTWGARLSVKHAVGTSLAIIALTSAIGASTYAWKGFVSAPLLLSVGAGAVMGAFVGAPLSAHLPDKPVRYAFAALAALVALYMFAQALGG